MEAIILPSKINGSIQAPASKSSMQRACAAALLYNGHSLIYNPGNSNDDLAAIEVIRSLGAIVEMKKDTLSINSDGRIHDAGKINCGESGLGFRMFAPIAALSSNEILINGSGSLLNRPMNFFDEIFPQLGISIHSNAGKLPISIKGPLVPKNITIDGSLSSQFLTGLLFAFAKVATKPVTITVTNLKSKPYIDLTLGVMKAFGHEVENINYEHFIIKPPTLNIVKEGRPQTYTVEGDWSGGAFLLVAGAIAGEITVKGLDVLSAQADKAILHALMMADIQLSIEADQIIAGPPIGDRGKAFHFNATDCPDLFPPLVALAAFCNGTTVIEGVNRLIHKESNRALTLQEEFAKMGVEIKFQDDLMLITGAPIIKGASLQSHHDHRIAMACTVAALKAEGKTIIHDAEAINKSYPGFYNDLKMMGADVSLQLKKTSE